MKKWYTIGGVWGLSFILASCYSFNNITLPDKSGEKASVKVAIPQVIKEEVKPRVDKRDEEVTLCPVYVMPAFSKTPELPFEEIMAADKNDSRALDKIRQDHIEDLRQYIARFKQELRSSHNDYLKTCYYRNGKQADRS